LTRTVRRVVQLGFLAFFIYLFVQVRFPLSIRIPPDLFLRFSPLLASAEMLALRKVSVMIFPAVILIVLTMLLGRVWCGWVCPLGTVIDASDVIFFRRRKTDQRVVHHQWKYLVLLAVLGAGVFGVQIAYLVDPLALLTRTMATVFYPLAQRGEGLFLGMGGSWLRDRGIYLEPGQFIFRSSFIILAVFVAVLALSAFYRRYWCNTLCPLGGLLAIFSLANPLRFKMADSGNKCGLCWRYCKMAALDPDRDHQRLSECIVCFDCVRDCARGEVRFSLELPKPRPREEISLPRRKLLQGVGLGAIFALGAGVEFARGQPDSLCIRPPGAIPEDMFLDVCARCGECMKACITNGLQPALTEAGIAGFWTPVLVPTIGYCAQPCTLCGEVCPTGAILPVTVAEKEKIKIGAATVYKDACIYWSNGQVCLVCQECCPYVAISIADARGSRGPLVDEEKCTGCGECETACPVRPQRAIKVSSRGDEESRKARAALRRVRPFPGLKRDQPAGANAAETLEDAEAGRVRAESHSLSSYGLMDRARGTRLRKRG